MSELKDKSSEIMLSQEQKGKRMKINEESLRDACSYHQIDQYTHSTPKKVREWVRKLI